MVLNECYNVFNTKVFYQCMIQKKKFWEELNRNFCCLGIERRGFIGGNVLWFKSSLLT